MNPDGEEEALSQESQPAENQLTHGPLLRAILQLSWPMMLGNFLQTAFNIIDMIFVGRLGPDAIAGVSMSGAMIHAVMTLVIGVDMGMRAMVSRFFGSGDRELALRVAGQALLMGGGLTIVLASSGIFWRREFLELLGAAPAVVEQGSGYLMILFSGIITMVYMFFVSGILQSIGDARTPMRVGAIAFAVNIVLDPLFIFGYGPIPALGVKGAALATVLSRGLAGLLLLRALFTHAEFRLRWHHLKPDFTLIRRILRIALPGSAQIACYSTSDVFATRLIAVFGTAALAAFGVTGRCIMMVMIVGFGLGGATATMVGQNLGAHRADRAERSVWLIAGLYTAFLAVAGGLFFPYAGQIIRLFTQDAETLAVGTTCLRIATIGFFSIPLNLIFGRALQGAGDTISPLVMTAFSRLPLLLGLLYALPRYTDLGINGLWYGFLISGIAEGLLKLIWFQRGKWKTQKV